MPKCEVPRVGRVTVNLPELRRSLLSPHRESAALSDEGFDAWARNLPEEDAEALVDRSAGTAVRWIPGEGWVEDACPSDPYGSSPKS